MKARILEALKSRSGNFTAVDIAEDINYPLTNEGVYPTCPQVRRILTQLCKDGMLYQWITGNGRNPFSFSNVPTYEVKYLKRDSELAQTLLNHPNRELKGYRFR